MFTVSRKAHEAILKARTFGVERFRMTTDQMQGCFFTLSLRELVDEEGFVDRKLAELSQRKVDGKHVDANRLLAATYDLAEIQFCLGLFAIGSTLPDIFNADDDTSAEDIYLQLMEQKELLPRQAKRLFEAAEKSVYGAQLSFSKVVDAVKSFNDALYSAGVSASRFVRKKTKSSLNSLGNWIANKTQEKVK